MSYTDNIYYANGYGTFDESLDFDAIVHMDTYTFHDICNKHLLSYDNIKISCNQNKIIFESINDFSTKVSTYDVNKLKIFNKNSYNLDSSTRGNLHKLNKLSNICKEVVLFFKKDYPLCLKYDIPTLGVFRIEIKN
jgi:hypothetical protein